MAATATNHWKLGLFVVFGIAATIAALFWVGAQRFRRESFPAIAFFDESVQGLDVGSPIKFRGVTVGTVGNITIAPDHRHVQVTSDIYVDAVRSLGISDGAPDPKSGEPFMPQNLRVQLVAAGITGVRFLEVDFFDPRRYPPPPLPFAPPWNYIPSAPSTLRSLEQAALEFANRLPALGEETSAALVEARQTLAAVHQLTGELAGDTGAVARVVARLDHTATSLETALHDAEPGPTTQALRSAAASVGTAATSVGGAADGVSDGLGTVQDDVRASLTALRDALEAIRAFIESLDRDPSVLVRGRRADGAIPAAVH
jgi:phospholipid/cholesterol/gamma-HCH transport system substrate-binding protein